MLASTIGITVVVALGVFAWTTLGGGGDRDDAADVGWDEVALIDRTTGAIVTYGPDGELVTHATGVGRVIGAYASGDRIALVRATELVLTAPTSGAEPTIVPIPARSVVTPVETTTTMHLLVGDPAGGNLLIVDVADGSVIDVGALAAPTVPKLFVDTVRVDAAGTRFAVADAAAFQTIVVGEGIDGAAFLADQPIAVGDELLATSQVVNLQADISLVDLERQVEAVVSTELPRGAVMDGDDLVMVSVNGGLFRMGPGDREAEQIATIQLPVGASVEWALPAHDGDRLVVGGDGFAAVVGLDGTSYFTTTFTTPAEPMRPRPAWRCLPVVGATGHALVALDTGEVLADLTGLDVGAVSDDGCTVTGERDAGDAEPAGPELVDAERTVALGTGRVLALSPDGHLVVRAGNSGRSELVAVNDGGQPADPILLVDAPANPMVLFLRR